jgi:hypothetical protein
MSVATVDTKFSAYTWVAQWPELVVAANELEGKLRSVGRPVAADMVLAAYGDFRDRLLLLGQDIAQMGTDTLKRLEHDTRVRPDTLGGGGPRLSQFLTCTPIPQDLGPGAVGINDEELLDDNVEWWITNEVGNTTLIGRKLFGVFYGGNAAPGPPDESMFRQHALFAPGPDDLAGGAIITHGIPARRFVEKSVHQIEREWLAGFTVIRSEFDARIARALATLR